MTSLKQFKQIAVAMSVLTLGACATQGGMQPAPAAPSNIPDWVMNPVIENGIADTQCLIANPGTSMSTLKAAATASARAELAKQINVNVKAMDKTFQRLTGTNNGPSSGTSFESVSKQITQQALSGSRAIKMDYVTLPPDNKSNFCVMVGLSPEQTKTLFKDLVQQAGTTNLSPDNQAVLYERFLAKKAGDEMEAELKNQAK